MESILAIGEYRSEHNIKRDGIPFNVEACVYQGENKKILAKTVECTFSENSGYHLLELGMEWEMDTAFLRKSGIYQSYNTNFQSFKYEDGCLLITDKKDNRTKIKLGIPMK